MNNSDRFIISMESLLVSEKMDSPVDMGEILENAEGINELPQEFIEYCDKSFKGDQDIEFYKGLLKGLYIINETLEENDLEPDFKYDLVGTMIYLAAIISKMNAAATH